MSDAIRPTRSLFMYPAQHHNTQQHPAQEVSISFGPRPQTQLQLAMQKPPPGRPAAYALRTQAAPCPSLPYAAQVTPVLLCAALHPVSLCLQIQHSCRVHAHLGTAALLLTLP